MNTFLLRSYDCIFFNLHNCYSNLKNKKQDKSSRTIENSQLFENFKKKIPFFIRQKSPKSNKNLILGRPIIGSFQPRFSNIKKREALTV